MKKHVLVPALVCGAALLLFAIFRPSLGSNSPVELAGLSNPKAPPIERPESTLPPVASGNGGQRGAIAGPPQHTAPTVITTLTVAVTDERGPLSAKISLYKGKKLVTQSPEMEASEHTFEELDPNDVYSVQVAGLPTGLLPPRYQRRHPLGAEVTLRPGKNRVELKAEHAVRVFGHITGPSGERLRDVYARFDCHESIYNDYVGDFYFDTNDEGWYEGDLYPGTWIIRLGLGASPELPSSWEHIGAKGHPLFGSVQPLPQLRMLRAGGHQIDLAWGVGPASLQVQVRDGRGDFFTDANFVLFPLSVSDPVEGSTLTLGMAFGVASGRTDARGEYSFQGLDYGRYGIVVEPEGFLPTAEPGKSVVGGRPSTLEVLLEKPNQQVSLTIPRARPVEVVGQITLRPELLPAGRDRLAGELILLPGENRAVDRRSPFNIRPDGGFSLWVEANEGQVLLHFAMGDTNEVVPLIWDPQDYELKLIPTSVQFPSQ